MKIFLTLVAYFCWMISFVGMFLIAIDLHPATGAKFTHLDVIAAGVVSVASSALHRILD